MEREWIFISNPFERPMTDSHIKAAVISAYTFAALQSQQAGNPAILQLAEFYEPFDIDLQTAYNTWRSQAGIQKGKTQSLKEALENLAVQARDWSFAIQAFHREGTPRYRELFPNGLTAFQKGKQQERIGAVASLIEAIGAEADLQPVRTTIVAYLATLTTTKTGQSGAKTETEVRANNVESSVAAAAAAMYYVYGGLVQQFYHQPARIEDFFNLALIRDREQNTFTGSVAAGAVKFVAKRTLPPTAAVRMLNNGPTTLRLYVADTKGAPPPAEGGLVVLPGGDKTAAAPSLGSGSFLHIYNEDDTSAGAYELVII